MTSTTSFVDAQRTLLAQTVVQANAAAASAAAAEAAAQQTADKAPINSPAFTGVPTAPTAAPLTDTGQLATTGFVTSQMGAANGIASLGADGKLLAGQMPAISVTEVFTVASQAAMLALSAVVGNIAIRTDLGNAAFILTTLPASTLANWTELATSAVSSVAGLTGTISASALTAALNAFVGDSGSGGTKGEVPAPVAGDAAAKKLLAASGNWTVIDATWIGGTFNGTGNIVLTSSPALAGIPTAPTAAVDTNTMQIATAAFVINQASASGDGNPAMDGVAARGTSTHFARADHVHPSDTSRATVASPSLTGVPTAPTAAPLNNSTQIATTAYADAAVAAGLIPAGVVVFTILSAAPAGWLLFNDGTLGDASSGSNHANADSVNVFTALFNNVSDADCPIFTSAGAGTTRAAQGTAAAAFAAHCRMSLPKALGRAMAVAGSGAGLSARALADTAGAETAALSLTNLPFVGTVLQDASLSTFNGLFGNDSSGNVNVVTSVSLSKTTVNLGGSSTAFGLMQPTTFLNAMVKL